MNSYEQAMAAIKNADHVLVSASNGLSISEGYHIFADNEAFEQYFGDFKKKYGIRNIIQGVFAPLPAAEHEQFMQELYRYCVTDYRPSKPMQDLKEILAGKDFFVVTSNSDTHFQLNRFPEDRLFEVEGNFFGLTEGSAAWNGERQRFGAFLQKIHGTKTVIFELGIGAANRLIKAPLMQLVAEEPSFTYITLNMPREIYIPEAIADRSIAVPGNIAETFEQMLAAQKQ